MRSTIRSSFPQYGTVRSHVQVIDRAVRLLGLLGEADEPIALSELAAQAELSRSTTRRILGALEAHGICERPQEGRYRLGMRVFELGKAFERQLDVRDRARPALVRLSGLTSLTAYLCVAEHDRAVCIDRVDGRFAHSLQLRVGGFFPLHVGAAPKALLAFSGKSELDSYLDTLFENASEVNQGLNRTTRADLTEALRLIRLRGWSIAEEEVSIGATALGAPIWDHTECVIAAISLGGLTPHFAGERKAQLLAHLTDAAKEISAILGFTSGDQADPAGLTAEAS